MMYARPMSYYESPDDDESEWEMRMVARGFTQQDDGSWVDDEGYTWSFEDDEPDYDAYDLE